MGSRWHVALALCIAAIVALLVALLVLIDTKAELMAAGAWAGPTFAAVAGLALTVVGLGRKKP
ncbi:hypothetical protein ACQEVF_22245 [Nonomuraea polychroma]|uniref:hypothetical protein n=1 Tax=Nonomuraea polychroma TaxID=46176 RepID=UPI003D8F62BA